ncbi:MAG: Rieske 2Fe-2S domain-containing protein, partial [Pseudonocardiaceae bacterium]
MTAAVTWVEAATLDDMWEGDILGVVLAGEPVLLVHLVGGDLRAYQGHCPHQEQLLADGKWYEET